MCRFGMGGVRFIGVVFRGGWLVGFVEGGGFCANGMDGWGDSCAGFVGGHAGEVALLCGCWML